MPSKLYPFVPRPSFPRCAQFFYLFCLVVSLSNPISTESAQAKEIPPDYLHNSLVSRSLETDTTSLDADDSSNQHKSAPAERAIQTYKIAFSEELSCLELTTVTEPARQINLVETNPSCADLLVERLLSTPSQYLEAFYLLIRSEAAADGVWWAVFQRLKDDQFRFDSEIIDDLYKNLIPAIQQCTDSHLCEQWSTFVIPALESGQMYRCPLLSTGSQSSGSESGLDIGAIMNSQSLLAMVPYGDYYCIEAVASDLGETARYDDVQMLIELAAIAEIPWARRNALRVLGRLAERNQDEALQVLMRSVVAERMSALLLDQLRNEFSEDVLLEAVWLMDTFYFPHFAAQPALEQLIQNSQISADLRYRAMVATTRLIQAKEALSEADLHFLQGRLTSDESWLREYAAFAFTTMTRFVAQSNQKTQIVAIMEEAYRLEDDFAAQSAMVHALDIYQGSERLAELQLAFEAEHLANTLTMDHISIRSGLPAEELPVIIGLMATQEVLFFDLFGPSFQSPVLGSDSADLELLLFASHPLYQQYMNAFVGYGGDAGGLYFESENRLYTYQRTVGESFFTVEHLIQHEFTHYLMGRYVLPGVWSDVGYHEQPKGWIDEGTAEFFAEVGIDRGISTDPYPRDRLLTVCDRIGGQSLQSLLVLRTGYDEPGTFDYDFAWTVMNYLIQHETPSVVNLFEALRNDKYKVEDFLTITGLPSLELVERDLRGTYGQECIKAAQELREAELEALKDPLTGSIGPLPAGPLQAASISGHTHQTVHHRIVANDRRLAPLPAYGEKGENTMEVIRLVEVGDSEREDWK
ncbi:MAG: collagenase [Chloroflexota bacterium]